MASARLTSKRLIREAIWNRRHPTTYGPMSVERHVHLQRRGIDLLVLLDGEDVTRRCTFADDRAGVVQLFRVDEEGRFYVDPENRAEAAREERRGVVRFAQQGALA